MGSTGLTWQGGLQGQGAPAHGIGGGRGAGGLGQGHLEMECTMGHCKAVARLTPVSTEPTSSPVFPSLHAQGLQDAAARQTLPEGHP